MGVKDRIKVFAKHIGITILDFERSISVANGYVNSISKSIGIDKIEIILEKYPNINIEWLLTGKGDMLKDIPLKELSLPPERGIDDLTKAIDSMARIIESTMQIEKLKTEIEKVKTESNAESVRLNAENEKLKLENERLNAIANERNSRSMENLISSLLAGENTLAKKESFQET